MSRVDIQIWVGLLLGTMGAVWLFVCLLLSTHSPQYVSRVTRTIPVGIILTMYAFALLYFR